MRTLEGALWHANKAHIAQCNTRLLSLPPYAPELNPVEHIWAELREKRLHNKVVVRPLWAY